MNESKVGGRLLVLVAAVLWSTSGLFASLLEGLPGSVMAFWRALFAGLALLPLARAPSFSWRLLPMLAAFALMNYSFVTALVEADPSCVIWLQHTAPAWVVLLSWTLFAERPQTGDVPMLVMALSGVAFILAFELQGESPRGVLLGLLAGVTYGTVVVSISRLRDVHPAWLISLSLLFTAAVLSPAALTSPRPVGKQWALLAAFGVLQMGLPYVLFARGLRTISSLEASGIVLLEPVLLPVWVFLAVGSVPSWWTTAGAGLILCGLMWQIRAKAVHWHRYGRYRD